MSQIMSTRSRRNCKLAQMILSQLSDTHAAFSQVPAMQDRVSQFPDIGFLIRECELKHLTEVALVEYKDPGDRFHVNLGCHLL